MKIRALALPALLCAFAASAPISASSAAELAIAPLHRHHVHHAHYVRAASGLVFWDDVYPPAIYGPYLRPVAEVAALKANALPVSVLYRHGRYVR